MKTLLNAVDRSMQFSAVEELGHRLGVDTATLLDLMRVARVFGEAIRVFGSESKAAAWLKTSNPFFQDAPPLRYLDSDAGAHVVSEEIVRIDFGDFA